MNPSRLNPFFSRTESRAMGASFGMQLSFTAVDPSRSGGTRSLHRHAFASGKPSLGQEGPPVVDTRPPSEGEAADVRSLLDAAIEILQTESQVVLAELDAVSPQTLRAEPGAQTRLPVVGEVLSPQELRTLIILDARQLSALAGRIETGSLSGYLTPTQVGALAAVRADLEMVISQAELYDLEPIPESEMITAEEHVSMHTRAVAGLIERAERALVAVEGGRVPVREPSEKAGTFVALLVVGIVAATIWAILE